MIQLLVSYLFVGLGLAMLSCIRYSDKRDPLRRGVLMFIVVEIFIILSVIALWPGHLYVLLTFPMYEEALTAAPRIFPDKPKGSWCPSMYARPGDSLDQHIDIWSDYDAWPGWFVIPLGNEIGEELSTDAFQEPPLFSRAEFKMLSQLRARTTRRGKP